MNINDSKRRNRSNPENKETSFTKMRENLKQEKLNCTNGRYINNGETRKIYQNPEAINPRSNR